MVDDPKQAKDYLGKILNNKSISVISIDCEAIVEMSRFGKLSLIQVNELI